MLVVDASALYEVVADAPGADAVRRRFADDEDQAAPHAIDVEVLNIIRREHLAAQLDGIKAHGAIEELRVWGGERFDHRLLLGRAWELRDNVRGWDAFYVALAEALDATLITMDGRLSRATGPRCRIELIE